MNSAGEEEEEQVDYEEDSGGENSMSFNGQARSTTIILQNDFGHDIPVVSPLWRGCPQSREVFKPLGCLA